MRTFAPKQPQKTVSSDHVHGSYTATLGLRPIAAPVLRLRRATGNQAARVMPQTYIEELNAGLTATPAARFGHDFNRIPVHPPAAGAIQTKLAISTPGDQYEKEADRVAEQVMRMAEPQLQHACACGGECLTCGSEQGGRKPAQMQRLKMNDATATTVPPIVEDVIRSPGAALDMSAREFMESRFGHDFSRIRVYAGPYADAAANAIQARAFTVGNKIVFGAGQYAPHTSEGRQLLAHELTHTIQQSQPSGAAAVAQRDAQILGGSADELLSLVTPDINIIPDILDYTTMAVGLSLGRSLTPAELGILRPVFGPHLNYSVIRICSHTVCSPDGIPRTIGNLIATPPGGISSATLVHEAAHVWQHQNGIRYAYITSALVAQFGAWLLTGSRSAAYNWQMYYNNSIPWMAWNAEAQAEYIEHHMALPPWYIWGTGGFLPVP